MIASDVQATSANPITPASSDSAPAKPAHGFSFHDILSAINPLQYLPVVGTLYRAVTGDTISEPLRHAGSMLVSGLMGGPVGLMTYIGTTMAQKATGIDPEKIISSGLHSEPKAQTAPTGELITALVSSTTSTSTSLVLSPEQLAAYGVTTDASGELRRGDITGADVLNSIELLRHAKAAEAYAANQTTALAAGSIPGGSGG
jgi:hypothetical protein